MLTRAGRLQGGKALRIISRLTCEVTAKYMEREHTMAGRVPLSLVDSGDLLGERRKKLTEVTRFDCQSRTRVQE